MNMNGIHLNQRRLEVQCKHAFNHLCYGNVDEDPEPTTVPNNPNTSVTYAILLSQVSEQLLGLRLKISNSLALPQMIQCLPRDTVQKLCH